MPKNLKITVSGETNTGKSTVCYLIKECLREKGFSVEFDGGVDYSSDIEFDNMVGMYIDEKTNALSQSVEIKLSEVQLNREPVITENPLPPTPPVDYERMEKYKAKMSIKMTLVLFVIMLLGSLPVLLYPEKQYLMFFFLIVTILGVKYSMYLVKKFWKVKY